MCTEAVFIFPEMKMKNSDANHRVSKTFAYETLIFEMTIYDSDFPLCIQIVELFDL